VELLVQAIAAAHRDNALVQLSHPRVSDVVRVLSEITKAVKKLDVVLKAVQELEGGDPIRRHAQVIAQTLLTRSIFSYRYLVSQLMNDVAEAQRRVPSVDALKQRGRPKGVAGGSRAFDAFVGRLYIIVRETGGRWTHYRDRISELRQWQGTLQPALERLRPYLPAAGFFPDEGLGRALERLAKDARRGVK
jgi:hypothetical protein